MILQDSRVNIIGLQLIELYICFNLGKGIALRQHAFRKSFTMTFKKERRFENDLKEKRRMRLVNLKKV